MKLFNKLFKKRDTANKIRYLPLATTGVATMSNLLKEGYTMLDGEPMMLSTKYSQVWEIDDRKKTFREINVKKGQNK